MFDRIAGVVLWTDNVQRLKGFYRDVLGLPLHSERPNFIAFALGEERLSIGLHDTVSGHAKDPFRIMVNLRVADITYVFTQLQARGVHFIREPEQEHWGGWVATFDDPDGNILQLLQPAIADS